MTATRRSAALLGRLRGGVGMQSQEAILDGDQLDVSIAALPADTGLFIDGSSDTVAPRPRAG